VFALFVRMQIVHSQFFFILNTPPPHFQRNNNNAQAKVFVTHTTLTPRVDPITGLAVKPYLGRAYFVEQLNEATRAVVERTGGDGAGNDGGHSPLGLVDYAAVGARFAAANQSYLADLIHPGRDVGLELANVYLNLAMQAVVGGGKEDAGDDDKQGER
jgi:hypothetical protein